MRPVCGGERDAGDPRDVREGLINVRKVIKPVAAGIMFLKDPSERIKEKENRHLQTIS